MTKDTKLRSDYTVEQHFEATMEDLIRDLSGGIAKVTFEISMREKK